ncbi:MAG: hypothetical protein IJB86_10955 [Clostridia bacterium]|nr:hypothetical protein [Clostridia bacterium]
MIKYVLPPASETVSHDFKISLNNGEAFFPYKARVSAMPYNTVWPGRQRPLDQTETASFYSFSTNEPTLVTLVADKDFDECIIRPLSKKITPEIDGRTISFTIEKHGQYLIELDGFHNALHLFVDPIRDFVEETSGDDVIYYGPGVHKVGNIILKSNQTVIIDSGAVVYGSFSAVSANNVKILGYGIIDGSLEKRDDGTLLLPCDRDIAYPGDNVIAVDGTDYTDWKYHYTTKVITPPTFRYGDLPHEEEPLLSYLKKYRTLYGNIRLYYCTNCEINGVVCRDSSTFCIIPAACNNLLIDYVKTVGMWRYNSDGIDLFNCSNVTVRNCFLRNFDDCMVLKGIKGFDKNNMENILIQGLTVWCDWGRALEIGAETCADYYRNIIFEDCDIVHGTHIMMDIQNGDRADVYNILFRNIRCEYTNRQLSDSYQSDMNAPYEGTVNTQQPLLVKMHDYCGTFSTDLLLGSIHDVTIEDITVYLEDGIEIPESVINGAEGGHDTYNITFRNILVNGKKIESSEEARIRTNEFTHDVHFLI